MALTPFTVVLFAYYILIGTSTVVVVKYTETSDGKLAYNTASAIFCVEFIKLLFAYFFDYAGMCGSSPDKLKTTSWGNWLRYAGPAFLYAVQNNLNVYATFYLSPHVFSLFNNSKVICAAVCGKYLLKQKFSSMQWLSLVLLVLALCVAKVKMLLGTPTCKPSGRLLLELGASSTASDSAYGFTSSAASYNAYNSFSSTYDANPFHGGAESYVLPLSYAASSAANGNESDNAFTPSLAEMDKRVLVEGTSPDAASAAAEMATFMLGVFLVVCTSFTSGLSGAVNEWLLKAIDSDVSLMRKNVWTYQWGCIFNTTGAFLPMISALFAAPAEGAAPLGFFSGFHVGVWALVVANASLGLTVSMVLKYFDNIIKCFGGSLIIFSVSFFSWLFFGAVIDAGFILAVLIFSVSSFMYVGNHNAILKKADAEAEEAARLAAQSAGGDLEIGGGTPAAAGKGSGGTEMQTLVGNPADEEKKQLMNPQGEAEAGEEMTPQSQGTKAQTSTLGTESPLINTATSGQSPGKMKFKNASSASALYAFSG